MESHYENLPFITDVRNKNSIFSLIFRLETVVSGAGVYAMSRPGIKYSPPAHNYSYGVVKAMGAQGLLRENSMKS